jgi:uncharacterized protein
VSLATLGDPKYISVRTFRKSGVAVDTPVWTASDGGRLYVTTPADSGKGKRIRNNPQVEICACDMRGRPQGPWLPAEARFSADPATYETAVGMLRSKYGIQFRIAMWRNRKAEHQVLEITDRAA